MSFWDSYLTKIQDLQAHIPTLIGVLLRKSDGSAISLAGNDRGAALVEIDMSTPGENAPAIVVPQTNAGAMGTIADLTPRGILLWSPDGELGSVANTAAIAVGYSGLTLANATDPLLPGGSMTLPCASLAEAYSVSASAGQTLRVRVL